MYNNKNETGTLDMSKTHKTQISLTGKTQFFKN